MPHLSELHGASTHLAVLAVPLYALLLLLRRLGRGGSATTAWEPWVLGAALAGVVASGVTGLLVRGQSLTQLRGSAYDVGGLHFWLGLVLAAVLLGLGAARWLGRRGAPGRGLAGLWLALAALATVATVAQGYLGGRMTYEHGVGVQALGQGRRSASGAAQLRVALAGGVPAVSAGRRAFARTGLGCASCHGDQAQGERGPRLAGGRGLDDFRRAHQDGLFPSAVVTDRNFQAIDAWLKTLG